MLQSSLVGYQAQLLHGDSAQGLINQGPLHGIEPLNLLHKTGLLDNLLLLHHLQVQLQPHLTQGKQPLSESGLRTDLTE